MPERRRTIVAVVVVALLATMAGCSNVPVSNENQSQTPEAVEMGGNAPDGLTAFTVEAEGQTYICFKYEKRDLVSGNGATGHAGLACEKLNETA